MIKTGMVVGTSTDKVWSQVAIKPLNLGNLLVIVKLGYDGESELLSLPQIGTGLLETLKDRLTNLNSNQKLSVEIEKVLADLPEGLTASVAAMMFESEKLVIGGVGDTEAYIVRKGQVGRIFTGGNEISGQIQPGDSYILTSVETPSSMGLTKWKEILLKGISGIEELAVNVHGKGNSGGVVTVFAQVADTFIDDNAKSSLGVLDIKQMIRSVWEKPLTIRREQLKLNAWVGLVITGVLLLGVVVGVVKRAQVVKEATFNKMKSQVEQRVSEAKSVGDLNPERAKYLFNSARDEVNGYLNGKVDDGYAKKANELVSQIASAETVIFRKEEVSINTLIETEVIKAGFEPNFMILDENGNIQLAKSGTPEIWGVSLKDKSSFSLELNSIKEIKDISIYKDRLFILNNEGVYSASKNKDEIKKIIEPDDLWGDAAYVDNYGGNVYVLDKGQGEIWKYPALSDGYGARRRWLGAGISLDLSNVNDFALDGDIWLVTSSGKLEQYRRGVPLNFTMEGFPYAEKGRLSNPTSIYLTQDKVYVAEAGAKRVVVFNKESGKYENQYVNEEFARAKAMVVYEGKCYILVDKKIIWFEL